MEELMAWFSFFGPLPRPTNQTSPGIWFQREIGRNLRDQQKLLLVGLTQIGAKWGSLFTRETPLLGPPGYRLVQRQDPVTDSFPESDRVESVPEIGPGQQPTSASRDSRMVNNQPTILVDRSRPAASTEPVPVVRRQQIGIEEQLFRRGMSPTSHYVPFGIQHPIRKHLTIAPH
ncbi:hypothetical protein NE237_016347 [Protea cynaroides]|uniref:Uncharacterized protein n=1 Tax=Protea cynaroides TaxID=273540 RepID=A0A9Q0GLK7_9MAGN|nr:hypothetical protein NE237_016347 [Protea cynaroides]